MVSNDFGTRQFRPSGKKAAEHPCDAGSLGLILVTDLQYCVAALRNLGDLNRKYYTLARIRGERFQRLLLAHSQHGYATSL